ncbi:MAG: ABC transporter ATP-binding protein [Bacteroidales bacterium]|jgi:putative ABC transport system ATP-binding protein|nr:ABC transporter ATP-binding protein [Bacteroidales bacterium]HPJ82476.1 ABC transporter ATP-binding protein [Bacteroidales bacterium]
MTDNEIVTLRDLYKRFSAGKGLLTALRDINLTFGKGEFSGIVGPSGSGKTTLLNIIGSLDTPTEGTATVLGKQTGDLSQKEAAALRNHGIGFIFQTYNLLPVYSIYENVEFALLLQKTPARERKERVMESLQWVGLADRAQSRPATLSGGECQRVAIARSIVKRPALILADEPSANLDSVNTHHILKTMKQLNRELGTTFLFSTHDEKVMQHLDRIIYLKDGSVEKDELC